MNKSKYAKERDEYIKTLEKPIRFTRGEFMSWFSFALEKEIHKQCFLFNRRKGRRPQAIKIKSSKMMTK